METDWGLYLPGHQAESRDDTDPDNVFADYLWICECGAAGEDVGSRDAHVLSAVIEDVKRLGTLYFTASGTLYALTLTEWRPT